MPAGPAVAIGIFSLASGAESGVETGEVGSEPTV